MEGVKATIFRPNVVASCLIVIAMILCSSSIPAVMSAPRSQRHRQRETRKGSRGEVSQSRTLSTNRVPMSDHTGTLHPTTPPLPQSQRAPIRAGSKSGFTSSQEYPSTCVPRSETVVVAKRGARKHTLRCPLGLRQPEIYWYIGGVRLDVRFQNKWQNLSRGRVRYGEFEVLRNGNLRVHDVTSKHEGRYYCQARPKAGSKRKNMPCSTIELRLEAPPRPFREMYRQLVIASRTNAQLDCKVWGYPTPTTHWVKDGHIISDNQKYTTLPNGALRIRNMTAADEGQYYCVATNKVAQRRIRVQVTVVESPHSSPPTIIKRPRNRRAKLGGTVTMTCVAVGGKPGLEINWEFHGENRSWQPLHLRHRQTLRSPHSGDLLTVVSELAIPVVSVADVGQYTCTAKNLVGTVHAAANLTLRDSW